MSPVKDASLMCWHTVGSSGGTEGICVHNCALQDNYVALLESAHCTLTVNETLIFMKKFTFVLELKYMLCSLLLTWV